MRVLSVVGHLGAGGTQRAAQNYTIGYKQAGCEVAVLAITAGGCRSEMLQQAGVQVFVGGELEEEQDIAVNYASNWKPDIVHIHRPGTADPLTTRVLKKLKTSKNRVLETNVFSRVDYSKNRELIDVHLHLSRWCLWKWSQWSRGIKPAPIGVVVPYMINVQSFYPATSDTRAAFRHAYKILQDAFVFGRIGQPLLPKWSPVILTAFAEIAKEDSKIYLLLVGLPSELLPVINSFPENVRNRIINILFLHNDQDLRTAYSAIDIFLHAATIGESFGMVLVEAMLCNCPVITLSTITKDNSQLEVVGHKRGGLVVTNQTSMIKAMIQLMQDEQLRHSLTKHGAEWVKQQYDISQVMPNLLKIAEISLVSENRQQLRTALSKQSNLTTSIKQIEIRKLVNEVIGKISFKEYILMKMIHNPLIYRVWQKSKQFIN